MRQYYRVIGTNETVLSCYWDWPPAEYLRPSRSSWPSWRWCRASLCRQSWPGKRQTCSCPAQTWSRTVAGKGWTGPVHLWQWENLKIGTKNQTIKSTLCPFYSLHYSTCSYDNGPDWLAFLAPCLNDLCSTVEGVFAVLPAVVHNVGVVRAGRLCHRYTLPSQHTLIHDGTTLER